MFSRFLLFLMVFWGAFVVAAPPDANLLALLEQAQLKDPKERFKALDELLKLTRHQEFSPETSNQAIPVLFELITDDDIKVRMKAFQLILRLDAVSFKSAFSEQEALRRVLEGMEVPENQERNPTTTAMRVEATALLAFCGRSAVPVLITILQSPSPALRRQAAISLGMMEGLALEATIHLGEAVNDPDPEVSKEAQNALHKIGL